MLDPPENQRLQSKQKFWYSHSAGTSWTGFRCCNGPTHHAASQPFALASGQLLIPASPLPQLFPSELSASPLRFYPGDHRVFLRSLCFLVPGDPEGRQPHRRHLTDFSGVHQDPSISMAHNPWILFFRG